MFSRLGGEVCSVAARFCGTLFVSVVSSFNLLGAHIEKSDLCLLDGFLCSLLVALSFPPLLNSKRHLDRPSQFRLCSLRNHALMCLRVAGSGEMIRAIGSARHEWFTE